MSNTVNERSTGAPSPSAALRVALWIAQGFICLSFVAIGLMKLLTPIPKLAAQIHWAGEYPVAFVRGIGLIDIAGGVGILLPAVTRIAPGLTVPAALGCTLLQICAIVFHVSRGEASFTPINFVFLATCIFILWGRSRRAPLASPA